MTEHSADLTRKLPESIDRSAPTYAREVLGYFQRRSSDVASVDELEHFVREQSDSEPGERRVLIQLHHSTLPKLAETDLFDYDPRSNTARFRDRVTERE